MENTAKNFALQLGSLVSLYTSVVALIMVLWGIITIVYPDAADGAWVYESAAGGMRFGIALLIVFFPTYIVLTRMVNVIRRTEQGTYLTLTKWLIYLSLLIGGAALLGDLVSVVYNFLEGDLALRFALKALAFFVVVGLAFTYYLLDVRGYWQANEKQSIQYAGGAGVLVIVAVVVAFMNIEPPAQVREMRIDEQQLMDLQGIQYQIQAFYSVNQALPGTLAIAYLESGVPVPAAPDERDAYTYQILSPEKFELCATFAHATPESQQSQQMMYTSPEMLIKNGENWNHGSGEHCFVRVINPQGVY